MLATLAAAGTTISPAAGRRDADARMTINEIYRIFMPSTPTSAASAHGAALFAMAFTQYYERSAGLSRDRDTALSFIRFREIWAGAAGAPRSAFTSAAGYYGCAGSRRRFSAVAGDSLTPVTAGGTPSICAAVVDIAKWLPAADFRLMALS